MGRFYHECTYLQRLPLRLNVWYLNQSDIFWKNLPPAHSYHVFSIKVHVFCSKWSKIFHESHVNHRQYLITDIYLHENKGKLNKHKHKQTLVHPKINFEVHDLLHFQLSTSSLCKLLWCQCECEYDCTIIIYLCPISFACIK